MGVVTVPTLFIVRADGRVTDIMRRMSVSAEAARFAGRVVTPDRVEPVVSGVFEFVDEQTLARTLESGRWQLVDVRNREEYSRAHGRELNIPDDELAARATRELTAEKPIAIGCGRDPKKCFVAYDVLWDLGFRNLSIRR
jgi:rhodanese-related sulfurtransferase